ncbi:MAG: S-layer homology domain-containing protein [Ruminococcaceae bacterium]|nr:S-layer homology domain-containing protein [Oscillospiraceae bacterium]
MKNLKKVLALVVAFTMMLSVAAFASYPDVAEDAAYKGAVDTLSALDILKGDDQGNFNPDATITRAEFAAVVCRALGLENSANSAKGATMFTDVPADFWGTGYINLASQLKVVSGYGDGTFGPNDPVTYEQAVKMLVVALGYEPMAINKGGWPTGYLVVASTYNMGKGIAAPANSDPAKRSVVAQLAFNALDIPLMEQTGFGNNIEYTIYDGENNNARKTLLTNKLGVAKLAGQVLANEKVAYTGSTTREGMVKFLYDDNFKNTADDWYLADDVDDDYAGRYVPVAVDAYYGETGADEYVGFRCVAYVFENAEGDYEIAYIAPQENKNVTVEFEATDIDTATNKDDTDNICYREDADARTPEVVDLASDIYVLWNNISIAGTTNGYVGNESENKGFKDVKTTADALAYLKDASDALAAKVVLIDWENDGYFDVVKVSEYQHAVVTEVDANRGRISTIDYQINLKLDEKDVYTSIKDIDGNVVALEDIQADDILAMISDVPNKDARYFENSLEIVVLPAADYKVNGTVTEENKNDSADPTIAIDGATYELNAAVDNFNQIQLGSSGDFFLGINGKVIGFIGGRGGANGTLGIIVQTEEASGGFNNNGTDIKMINEKGEIVIYTTGDRVKLGGYYDVDETAAVSRIYTTASVKVAEDALAAADYANTNWDGLIADGDTVKVFLESDEMSEELVQGSGETDAEFAARVALRVVKYKVNSNNEITELLPVSDASSEDDGFFNVHNAYASEVEYNENLNKLDKALAANAVVLNLDNDDLDKSSVAGVESLVHDGKYRAILLDEVDKEYAYAILVYDDTAFDNEKGWAVVTAKSNTKVDDEEAVKVTVLENGEEEAVSLLFTTDCDESANYENLTIGSIINYNADANGVVSKYEIVGTMGSSFSLAKGNGVTTTVAGDDIAYYYGFITASRSGKLVVCYDDGDSYELVDFKVGGANQYWLNNASTRTRIEVGGFEDGEVAVPESIIPEDDEDPITEAYVSYVVLRVVEDELVDIMSIDNRVKVTISDYSGLGEDAIDWN